MTNYFSEKSNCWARFAMLELIMVLNVLERAGEGDQSSLGRDRDEIQTAINELGVMNRREQVMFDAISAEFGKPE